MEASGAVGPAQAVGVDVRAPRRRVLALVALALLASAYAVLALAQARSDSPTFDEPVYVSAGLLALREHDLAYNAEHPPLAKALAALPVLATGAQLPPGHVQGSNDERTYSATFLQAQRDTGRLEAVTLASRLVPVAEGLAVAVVLLLLGRALLGVAAGTLAAGLWLVSPMVLGLAHLDGVDLPFALAVSLYAAALLGERRRGDVRSRVLLGAAMGGVLATSMLGLVLVPVTVALLLVRLRRAGVVASLAVLATAWAVLWASYAVLDPRVLVAPELLLPAPYVDGVRYLLTVPPPSTGYLLGATWTGGRWWFWPGSLLVKLTTPVLFALVVGPFLWRRAAAPVRRESLVVLAVPSVVLALALMTSSRDLGVRLLLPVVALWCVGASALVLVPRSLGTWAVGVAAAVAAVGMLAVSVPHSLAFASPPFVPAYRVVTDSNVDWGQDLAPLQQWAVGRDPYVAWFGPRGTSYADVPGARDLATADPAEVRGWVAVSATRLTGDGSASLAWLRAYCPVGTVGGSVLLYRFVAPPVVGPAPAAPAPPCAGDVSVRVPSA